MNSFREIAVDMATIFMPSIILIFWVNLSFKTHNSPIEDLILADRLFSGFVDKRVLMAFILVFVLIIIKSLFSLFFSKNKSRINILKEYIYNILYVFILIIGSMILGYITSILFKGVQIDDVVHATKSIISIENSMFPPNSIFLIHLLPIPLFIEILIAWSYGYLILIFIVTFALVFIFNSSDFRKLVMTITITPLLFFPFWILFPATSPEGFYVENIFNQKFSESETIAISKLERSDYIENTVRDLNKVWISRDNSYFNVSSIPSLHVAWGLILVFFGIRIRKSLGIFYIPWFILNIIGTFYLFQHFILDAVVGVFLGAVILWFFMRNEE